MMPSNTNLARIFSYLLAVLIALVLPVHWQQHHAQKHQSFALHDAVGPGHLPASCEPDNHKPKTPQRPYPQPTGHHQCAFCLVLAGTWSPLAYEPGCLVLYRQPLSVCIEAPQQPRFEANRIAISRGPPLC